jgi:hypothetical protein
MKKTLLINGCSYVAGDDIAWDHQAHGLWKDFPSSPILNKMDVMDNYVKTIRPLYNFSGILSRLLNTTSVDISRDGNSNSEIALTTIGYISNLTPAEKKNLHVCIGWSEPFRLCRWSVSATRFATINATMLDWYKTHKDSGGIINDLYTEFYANSIMWISSLTDIDILVDDIFRILSVENYLRSEGITYTFWKSLGPPASESSIKILKDYTKLNLKNLNSSNWIKFADSCHVIKKYNKHLIETYATTHPYIGIPWRLMMEDNPSKYITIGYHPSKIAVEELSNKIVSHIQMSESRAFE